MKPKHTPGPWTVGTPKGYRWQHIIQNNKDAQIAFVNHGTNVHSAAKDDAESTANARLIAAAPEMLAALIGLIREWDESGQDGVEWNAKATRLRNKRIRAARIATAKAEGWDK